MAKKKVTAPLTHNPGKGRPKEHLAYLNWQEMEALRRLNGNNTERGPKGLPSFADDSASSKGVSRGGQGAVGSNSGSRGSTPSSGSRGSSSSGYNARESSGTGGYGGTGYGGSNASVGSGGAWGGSNAVGSGSGRSSTDSGSYGGGGGRDSGAKSAGMGRYNADTTARQTAAEKDAVKVSRESPALRTDAGVGGIRSINVGPKNTPISVSRPSDSSISGALGRVSSATYKDVTPTSPGGGGMGLENARRGSSTVAVGPSSGSEAFRNIAGGSPSAVRLGDIAEARAMQQRLSQAYNANNYPNAPSGVYGPRAIGNIPSYLKTATMPGMITTGMSSLNNPSIPADYSNPAVYTGPSPSEVVGGIIDRGALADYGRISGSPYQGTYTSDFNDGMSFGESQDEANAGAPGSIPDSDKERILAIENVPEETFNIPPSQEGIGFLQDRPIRPTDAQLDQIAKEEALNRRGIKYMEKVPLFGPTVKIGERIQKFFTGKDIADYATENKYKLLQMSPDQQRLAMSNDPAMRRAGVSLGIAEPRTGNQIYAGGPSSGMGGQDTGSRSGIAALPGSGPKRQPPRGGTGSSEDSGRSYKYYQWDLDMNVPSQGDPDYNEYMEYLAKRRTDYG